MEQEPLRVTIIAKPSRAERPESEHPMMLTARYLEERGMRIEWAADVDELATRLDEIAAEDPTRKLTLQLCG